MKHAKEAENNEPIKLTEEESKDLTVEDTLSIIRFTNDFGKIDPSQIPEEKRENMLEEMRKQEFFNPYLNTNYYRVNYYARDDGNFFYSDVVPDERSSFAQWAQWGWLKSVQHFRNYMFPDSPNMATQQVNISENGVNK